LADQPLGRPAFVELLEHEIRAAATGLLQRSDNEFAEIGGGRVAVEQADAHMLPPARLRAALLGA
jgi:hypothetical protein